MNQSMNTMYYNRTMNKVLEDLVLRDYKWLIDAVIKNPELDFQTGSNDSDSWFSVYRGTGRILTIKKSGKIEADAKYVNLNPHLYISPNQNELDKLLRNLRQDKGLSRYYIGNDGKPKEGYYQNLISRRYSLFCKPEDDFVVIDKEFVLGYTSEEIKRQILKPLEDKYDSILRVLKKQYEWCKNVKQSGTECDFLGITRNGDILLLELKRRADTPKISISPLQAGKYEDMTRIYLEKYPEDFFESIKSMFEQKVRMRLLNPKWPLPPKLSGEIRSAVVVGGGASEEAQKRFEITRKVLGKDIPLYTCNDNGGLLRVL